MSTEALRVPEVSATVITAAVLLDASDHCNSFAPCTKARFNSADAVRDSTEGGGTSHRALVRVRHQHTAWRTGDDKSHVNFPGHSRQVECLSHLTGSRLLCRPVMAMNQRPPQLSMSLARILQPRIQTQLICLLQKAAQVPQPCTDRTPRNERAGVRWPHATACDPAMRANVRSGNRHSTEPGRK